MTIRIAIVGVGKIARDQHVPTLAQNSDFALVAGVTRHEPPTGVPCWPSLEEMLAAGPPLDAVTICTPPQGRHAIARQALDAGLHVMLEKPPGATVSEVEELIHTAKAREVSLFATWHSREAPAVSPAKAWLADKKIGAVTVRWKEDVRRWHPGQSWIWEPGGLGVFDPGINALAVITEIMPGRLFLQSSDLSYPANKTAPIAAQLALSDAAGTAISAEFDWRQTGEQLWEVIVETDAGPLHLSEGGAKLTLAGAQVADRVHAEYPGLYRRFARLVANREIDADLAPFKLVADAFMLARRTEVEAFEE